MDRARAERWAVAAPLLTPALMVYYLCCWPGDAKSETSSEKDSRSRVPTPASTSRHGSVTRRASDLFQRKVASSVVSLHLPGTSGHKKEPLSAHRSHEEIRRHVRGVRAGPGGPDGGTDGDTTSRYHSAPSVIDEVLHRRDWERSTRDLHIPLRSPGRSGIGSASGSGSGRGSSPSVVSPSTQGGAPRAEAETSSLEEHQTDDQIVRTCKKHYTNIKSSKRKENDLDEDKDRDATEHPAEHLAEHPEPSTFYIGDNDTNLVYCLSSSPAVAPALVPAPAVAPGPAATACSKVFQAKEAKQTFNESIRRCDRPRGTLIPLEEHLPRVFPFSLDDVIDRLDSLDRSGAKHHTIESRISLSKPPHPPPSVEAVGYEGGACYLSTGPGVAPVVALGVAPGARARHASDGDILAPAHACRPESGAFSESDLDLEVEVPPPAPEEVPPPYEELQHFASPKKKETAI